MENRPKFSFNDTTPSWFFQWAETTLFPFNDTRKDSLSRAFLYALGGITGESSGGSCQQACSQVGWNDDDTAVIVNITVRWRGNEIAHDPKLNSNWRILIGIGYFIWSQPPFMAFTAVINGKNEICVFYKRSDEHNLNIFIVINCIITLICKMTMRTLIFYRSIP